MKRTSKANTVISEILEEELGITFDNREFNLNSWGHVDNYCKLSIDTLVLLECERGQKHPTTNVLKVYPFLEEQNRLHVILIHYFFPENKTPKNRLALCDFLGNKLEKKFGIRFQYAQMRCKPEEITVEIKKHNRLLLQAPMILNESRLIAKNKTQKYYAKS